MKTLKKLSTLFIAAAIVLCGIAPQNAAAEEVNLPFNFGLEIVDTVINAGQTFLVNVTLDFDQDKFAVPDSKDVANGIVALRCNLHFDSKTLQLTDPKTGLAIERNENGGAVSGKMFRYGNLGKENNFSAFLQEDGENIVLFYGSGVNKTDDIFESDRFVQFAFKAKTDFAFDGSAYSSISISNPEVSVSNKEEVKLDLTSDKLTLKILPPFEFETFGNQTQGDELSLSGTMYANDDDKTLTACIMQGDNTIEEINPTVNGKRYSVKFDLTEDKYPVGSYKLVMAYGNQTAARGFEITAKSAPAEPTAPVTPTNPDDDKKNDGKKDDDKKDNNAGGNTGNTGGNGTNLNDKTNTNKNTDTKPSADANKDNQNTNDTSKTYPSDIASHWAKSNIEYVYDHSLMNGYPDGTFAPENNITRAEFATVMSKYMGLGENAAAANKFSDADKHWAKGYIGALYEKGIVNGTSDTSFAPDANISRQEIAAILSRAFNLTEKSGEVFADNDLIDEWASDFVYTAKAAGYMQGDENNNFNPQSSATRAEVATIIYRLHSVK